MMHKRPIIPLHEVANLAAHGLSEDDDDEATGTNSDSSIPSVILSPQATNFLPSSYKASTILNGLCRNRPSMGPLRKNKRLRHEETDDGETDYKLWQSISRDEPIPNLLLHRTPMLNSDRKKKHSTQAALAAATAAAADVVMADGTGNTQSPSNSSPQVIGNTSTSSKTHQDIDQLEQHSSPSSQRNVNQDTASTIVTPPVADSTPPTPILTPTTTSLGAKSTHTTSDDNTPISAPPSTSASANGSGSASVTEADKSVVGMEVDVERDSRQDVLNNNNNINNQPTGGGATSESRNGSLTPENCQSIQSPKRKPKKGQPGRKAKNKTSHHNLRRNPRRSSTAATNSALHKVSNDTNLTKDPSSSHCQSSSHQDDNQEMTRPGSSSVQSNGIVSQPSDSLRKRGSSKTPKSLDPVFIDSLFKCVPIATELDIYWTKVKGHPYWPSQRVELTDELEESDRFRDAQRWRRQGDDICVMYFGTSEVAYANFNESCLLWDEGLRREYHLRQMHRYAFHDSLREVVAICQKIPIYPENWWNQPKWHALMLEFYAEVETCDVVSRLQDKVVKAERESICWVKLRGFPHWPVQMMPPHVANQQYPGLKKRSYLNPGNSSAPCMFFGTGEVAMIPDRLRVSFGAGLVRGYHRCSERRDFLVALGEVWGFLKNPRYWPEGGNNDVEWWCKDPNDGKEVIPWKEVALHFPPPFEYITRSVRGPVRPNQNTNKSKHRPEVHRCVCPSDPNGPCCKSMQCLNWASRFFCDSACAAKNHCKNLPFNVRKGPRVQPFMTTNCRGWGLRLEEPITAGAFIIEYVGEIIDEYELESRLDQARKDRCHEYYTMDLENDLFIDATRKGNESRFINSSCEPNCDAQKWTDPRTGETRIGVFALKTMSAGTELTYNYCFKDYGLRGEKQTRSFHCRCGTASCCMLSNAERTLAKILVNKKLTVKWDDGWYPGVVKSYNTERKRFQVEYEDGDVEYLLFEFHEQHENPIPFIADDETEKQLKTFRGESIIDQPTKKKKINPK